MDVRTGRQTYRWMDGWMNGRTDGWMNEWTDGRTEGWTDGRVDGWIDRRADQVTCRVVWYATKRVPPSSPTVLRTTPK